MCLGNREDKICVGYVLDTVKDELYSLYAVFDCVGKFCYFYYDEDHCAPSCRIRDLITDKNLKFSRVNLRVLEKLEEL